MHKTLKLHDYIHSLSILYSLKLVVHGTTDQPDGPTDIATYRAAIAALKKQDTRAENGGRVHTESGSKTKNSNSQNKMIYFDILFSKPSAKVPPGQ
jgi:hypothetical protein